MEVMRRLATGFGFVGAVGFVGMKVSGKLARDTCSTQLDASDET